MDDLEGNLENMQDSITAWIDELSKETSKVVAPIHAMEVVHAALGSRLHPDSPAFTSTQQVFQYSVTLSSIDASTKSQSSPSCTST